MMTTLIDSVIYVPKLDRQNPIDAEKLAIEGVLTFGQQYNLPVFSFDQVDESVSIDAPLFISLGGDGTMLAAMRAASNYKNGTVLGINFGKLGFLTSFDGNSLYCRQLFSFSSTIENFGDWSLNDERLIIEGTVLGPIGTATVHSAANEFLITTPTRYTPLEYGVYINDQYVATQSGDGVIIATPTGSTAYAMSAGGAIMSPTTRALQIVPLAAHTLSSRPIIISENDRISIKSCFSKRNGVIDVLADGQQICSRDERYDYTEFDMSIQVKSSVKIWRPKHWNFFHILSEKMGWGK